MKRLLLAMCLVIVVAFAFYGTANAVGGVCSNCHTMHASQDGSAGTPNATLLKSADECLGCHGGTGSGSGAPLVDKTGGTGMPSGGSFNDDYATSQTMTHNVSDLSVLAYSTADQDTTLLNDPPGNTMDGTGNALTAQLKCGGTNGCHGNHTSAGSTDAVKGMHHATKVTYKFLKIAADNSGAGTNVAGTSSADYEQGTVDGTNHNIYAAGGTDSISQFCNNCHDDFHGATAGETGTASPWKRHPTDLLLTGAMASATIDYVNTPFAFVSADRSGMATTTTTNYTAAKGNVMCLSCHRAHASNQPDLLRFAYSGLNANAGGGGTTGCLACHVNQR
ncbi:MAG: cytochrome c3 family protein [Thermodesulfovibrionia bacterium]|nr:cytochrome c3 family protein [Thermodesulfovibrionia bacterium]